MTINSIELKLVALLEEASWPWRLPSLATLSADGPQQRSLVLRRFNPKKWELVFFTDFRSTKIKELQKDPRASLHFYDSEKQLQLRLKGIINIEHQSPASREALAEIPIDRRGDYQSGLAPGEVLSDISETSGTKAEANFALLRFQTKSLDYLEINRVGHRRLKAEYIVEAWTNWTIIQA